jgi:DNA-3-methyladenine glycosylase
MARRMTAPARVGPGPPIVPDSDEPASSEPGSGDVGTRPGHELRRLDRTFFRRDARVVAVELLNMVLVHDDPVVGRLAGRIIEVEAYLGADDPASHAFRGPTPRNRVMFGPAGHLYVYFSYGMHWCANAVTGDDGVGTAVLLRALQPLGGIPVMRSRRPAARRDRDLCSGPARLTQALGIDGRHDGVDLCDPGGRISIVDDGTPAPTDPVASRRIGITKAVEHLWRWQVP